jgi:NAD(P)-dependent dehydrogenase (short-subunit alcohol dehydrogenase family)
VTSSLDDQRIILTGASSGIGRAVAQRLAERRTTLALIGRNTVARDWVAGDCRTAGALAVQAHVFDLADTSKIEQLVAGIVHDWGAAPDMVIHCAGIGYIGAVDVVPIAEVERCLAVNFTAAVALARASIPSMRARGSGRLVFFSSGTAWHGVPGEAAYAASKAAVERFAEGLAIELDSSGISVVVVSPGPVDTPMLRTPRVFGGLAPIARPVQGANPDSVAVTIVARLASPKGGRIEAALRPRLVRHLAYWTPGVLRSILSWQFRLSRK